MCQGRSGSSSHQLEFSTQSIHSGSAHCDTVSLAFVLERPYLHIRGFLYCPPEKCCSRVCHAPPLRHLDIWGSILWPAQSSAGRSGSVQERIFKQNKKQTKKFVLSLKFLDTITNNSVTGAFRQLQGSSQTHHSIYISRWWCSLSTTRWWCRTQLNRSYV